MKKKVLSVFVAVLMLFSTASLFAGCSDNSKKIEILLLANSSETAFYRTYFEDMEKTLKEDGLDYKIEFRGLQEADYYQSLKSAINRNKTPDIFYIRPNEILQYKDNIVSLQDYADGAGKEFANLSEIYDTALDSYRYNPTTGALGNPNDDLYAFPKDLSVQQLGYYKPLLESFTTAIKKVWPQYKEPWNMNWSEENYTWEQYKTICKVIAENATGQQYASDVPSIEVLINSFGGELIDLSNGRANATVNSLTDQNGAIYKAIKYQAELVDCGGADYGNATYANFTAKRVCFYGQVGSWEITDYDKLLGAGNWGVMPWPTVDGSTDWKGLITSAGYVVSKTCAESEKGDIAKRIAISFMSPNTQDRMVRVNKISLPLRTSVANDYRTNDETYSPASRGIFLDVISGEKGFFPAEYSTYDSVWLDELSTDLEIMWNKGKGAALTQFNGTAWGTTQGNMQEQYNATKGN